MRLIKAIAMLCMALFIAPAFSQEKPKSAQTTNQKLIIDPKVRYGKLSNGLTYYIRHNELPKQRAEFYLVNNVGSMQEEESQRGLAHFLEHMAFNGTKNFPAQDGIQDYTERKGMRFGENLNAYTSFDETVYMLMNVPVDEAGIIDSSLLILHDWSSFLLLRDEDIEKERNVIREEWRSRNGAQSRLWEQQLPKMFPDCKYGVRIPIGKIDIINNFKGDELRAYYKKWYRPDLQAAVIVGDIDVDEVEAKLKKVFSDIAKPIYPAKKEKTIVKDNEVPIFSIAKDKEVTNTQLTIYYKHEQEPEEIKGTLADFLISYNKTVISMIMSERFADIVRKANSPFVSAYADDGDYSVAKTKGAWTTTAIVKPGELQRAMNALVAETESIKKFGFTEAEYDRAKKNILRSYENTYEERDKMQSSTFAEECVRNFTNGEAMPGIEAEYEIIKKIAPDFPLDGINNYATHLFDETRRGGNIVISLTGPDQSDVMYPTEEELFKMFIEATKELIEEKENETVSLELLPELPTPGTIVSEVKDPLFDATVFTLGNGVRVIAKQTDYKADEIKMTATSPGGLTLFKDDKDIWNIKLINNAIMVGGLGKFSATDLSKALAGKNVSLNAGIGDSNENFNGSASPSDLRTLFELIYLQFKGLRVDDEAYKAFLERVKPQLDNAQLNPNIAFSDTVAKVAYNGNPRNRRIKSSDFVNIDYHRMIDMYAERYADASDFVFTFVGNINLDSIRPLLKQYLANAPALYRKEKGDENRITPFVKGINEYHFTRALQTPKTTIGLIYSGQIPYNLKNIIISQLVSQMLDFAYIYKVREQEGASYSVNSEVKLYDFPEGRTTIQVYLEADPAKKDKILNIVKSELDGLANNGPGSDTLLKSVLSIKRARKEILQENDYWLNILDAYYYRGFDGHTEYDKILDGITADDIKSFVKTFLDQGNLIEVVMSPE